MFAALRLLLFCLCPCRRQCTAWQGYRFVVVCGVAALVGILHGSVARALPPQPSGEELFERKIRPLLIRHCYKCHAKGERSKSGLQVDSREGLLRGGKRGPAIVPGRPEESLLIQAVAARAGRDVVGSGAPVVPDAASDARKTTPSRKSGSVLRMPPRGPLDAAEIEALVQWVQLGAPWPKTRPRPSSDTKAKTDKVASTVNDSSKPPHPSHAQKQEPGDGRAAAGSSTTPARSKAAATAGNASGESHEERPKNASNVDWTDDATPAGEDQPTAANDPATAAEHDLSVHWAFRGPRKRSLPKVNQPQWCQSPIDYFILARLEEAGLQPAPPADKRTLIRRATYDLIGLPPTPEEIEAFLNDQSPDAFAKVVDRLLASPHYGERWGRHWLDLVRYAETDGHEFDPDKPGAYLYRDYVIEAFNDDLPYDRFIQEQLAGDLLPEPRLSGDGARRASDVATAFYWLGEVQNVPVDQAAADANVVENQIDVIGKTFLGLTVACARCHDHKFDPITTEDYYALAGILYSSRRMVRCVDSESRQRAIAATRKKLAALNEEIARLSAQRKLLASRDRLAKMADHLLAAREVVQEKKQHGRSSQARRKTAADDEMLRTVADRFGLQVQLLNRWVLFLEQAVETKDPVFYPWARLAEADARRFDRQRLVLAERLSSRLQQWRASADRPADDGCEPYDDFEAETYTKWRPVGAAWGRGPARHVSLRFAGVEGQGCASSWGASDALVGRLISEPFTITKPYVHFRIAGGKDRRRLRLSLMINDQPLPEITATGEGDNRLRSGYFEAQNLLGREAYFELVDESTTGHLVVDAIALADGPPPDEEPPPNALVVEQLLRPEHDTPRKLAAAYQQLFVEAARLVGERLEAPTRRSTQDAERAPSGASQHDVWWEGETPEQSQIIGVLLSEDSPWAASAPTEADPSTDERPQTQRLQALREARRALERNCPTSAIALITAEGVPHDVAVQERGNPHDPGPIVPRRFIEQLDQPHLPRVVQGSGRRELAQWIADANNPLTARVAVNRIWQHHFGRGIVGTPENFGALGEEPTHPDLLDYLALRFIESGWSFKAMHRLLMLSSTYQQASQPDERAVQVDSGNRLWHHMPLRRLEAEAVRDAMLCVAGTLDRRLYGPSVPLHVTPFMQGRSVPETSGPLDGDGRRSIYLEVRRNHLTPLLQVFDFPQPTTTTAQRNVSAVAPMALAMMNNEFVAQQAAAWARRLLSNDQSDGARIQRMFEQALGRPPRADEQRLAETFLEEQKGRYKHLASDAQDATPEQRAWADLCHVVFQFGEFFFVR